MELALTDLLNKLETIAIKYSIASIESFRRLPPQKELPEYYELIKHPMDLVKIEKKIKKGKYASVNELFNDVELMSKNAIMYNDPSSLLYESADKFFKYLSKNRKRLVSNMKNLVNVPEIDSKIESGILEPILSPIAQEKRKRKIISDKTSGMNNELYNLLDNLIDFASSNTNTDSETTLSQFFFEDTLPDKDIIELVAKDESKYPRFFSDITEKIEIGSINSLKELVANLNSCFDDAIKTYKPSSETYKSGKILKNFINSQDLMSDTTIVKPTAIPTVSLLLSPKRRVTRKATNSLTSRFDVQTLFLSKRSRLKNKSRKESLKQEDLSLSFQPVSVSNHDKLYCKMNSIYKILRDLKKNDGKCLVCVCYDFLFCPSPFVNPEYYDIVKHPIDMSTIFKRLRHYEYSNFEQFLGDFKLLFDNIKSLTAKNSPMQKNVLKIENQLLEESQLKSLKHIPDGIDKFSNLGPRDLFPDSQVYLDTNITEKQAIKTLLSFITEISDTNGRCLLPSLHLEKILADVKENKNKATVSDVFQEINLFLDNYSLKHPSDINFYEDAVLFHYQLYRFTIPYLAKNSPKMEPLIKLFDIITAVWNSILDYNDSLGHIFHYSLVYFNAEKSIKKSNETITRTITFDLINFCVVNNLYTNFETFQDDFLSLCSHIRSTTNVFSEPHRDVIELLTYFVRTRDKLIGNLDTNALNFHSAVLHSQLQTDPFSYPAPLRANIIDKYFNVEVHKLTLCKNFDDYKGITFLEDYFDGMNIENEPFRKGDSVEMTGSDLTWLLLGFLGDSKEKNYCVVAELKSYMDLPRKYTRTYLLSVYDELIVTDYLMIYPVNMIESKIDGIFYAQHYIYHPDHPQNISFFDHFYSYELDEYFFIHQFLVEPPAPLVTLSSKSVAPANVAAKMDSLLGRNVTLEASSLENRNFKNYDLHSLKNSLIVASARSVEDITSGVTGDDGLVHYLQVTSNNSFYRRDEYVYLYDKEDELTVGKIVDMWKDKKGQYMFKATILYFPDDFKHSIFRMFYPNEVFKTNVEVIHNIDCIYSHCWVMHPKYYFSKYPVVYKPSDVFLCESSYNLQTNQIRKNKPFRSFFHTHPHMIYEECISMKSESASTICKVPSPQLLKEVIKINDKRANLASLPDRSNEEASNISAYKKQRRSSTTKKSTLQTPTPKPSPFVQTNCTAEEDSTSLLAKRRLNFTPLSSKEDTLDYVCKWKNCNTQFQSNDEILDHILKNHQLSLNALPKDFQEEMDNSNLTYVCFWNDCSEKKNDSKFRYLHQLIQHIKDYHVILDSSNTKNTLRQVSDVAIEKMSSLHQIGSNYDHITNNTSFNNADITKKTPTKGKNSDPNTSEFGAIINSEKYMNHFYLQLVNLKSLISPFLTTVSESIQELNSQIDHINSQIINLRCTVVEQNEVIKKLKESQKFHSCCYGFSGQKNTPNTFIELGTSVDYSNSDNLVNGSTHNNHNIEPSQTTLIANPDFFESASADLLRYALQQSTHQSKGSSPQNNPHDH